MLHDNPTCQVGPAKCLVLALDGKMARRAGQSLHMVSAFLVREGLTVAQEPCDRKSNEITALPRLLDRIHLQGAVVTIDDADCVLALKRNQGTLHREIKAAFDDADQGTFAPEAEDRCEIVEHNGGRRQRRTGTVLGGPGLCEWVADAKRYDPAQAEALQALVRGHWGIENGLHRTLDVRAVPGGRLSHVHWPHARRHGHPAPDRPEHAAHDSTETRNGRVHRTVARPHRTPTLEPGAALL